MKPFIPAIVLLSAPFACANQLLDILEGKIDANSVSLPPPPPEFAADLEKQEASIIYLEPEWAASPPDIIWSRAVLYDNSANPWIQQVAMMGYFDFTATFGEADTDAAGGTASSQTDLDGTRTRRARLGARIRAFNNTEVEAVGEFAGDSSYRGIERLKASTQLSDNAAVTYGKFKPFYGSDSRNEERLSAFPNGTMLGNMIAPAPSLGVSFRRTGKYFDYDIGWFSGDFSPDMPRVQGDGFVNLGLSRTYYTKFGDSVTRTRWHAEYIHNFEPGTSNPAGYDIAGRTSANGNQLIVQNPAYRHLISTGFTIDAERYSLNSDLQFARGDTSVWGLQIGGSYWAMPGALKIVGRYQYAGSKDAGGIVTTFGNSDNLRYDSSPFFIGDEFHSFYLGANLHLYKDELVLRNGLEYSVLNDEGGGSFNTDGFSWHSGATISF